MPPKGNEELKAKIAKIQEKSKAKNIEAPTPVPEDNDVSVPEEASMEELDREYEAKKKALIEKAKAKPIPEKEEEQDEVAQEGISKAIEEYSDDSKFRVELIFQLVKINTNLEKIANAVSIFAQNGGSDEN